MYPNSDPGMFWVAFYGCLLAEVIPVPIEVPLSRQVTMSLLSSEFLCGDCDDTEKYKKSDYFLQIKDHGLSDGNDGKSLDYLEMCGNKWSTRTIVSEQLFCLFSSNHHYVYHCSYGHL